MSLDGLILDLGRTRMNCFERQVSLLAVDLSGCLNLNFSLGLQDFVLAGELLSNLGQESFGALGSLQSLLCCVFGSCHLELSE
jgi:hypothetical protein